MKPGRNDPCPCGSGKKYKQCCLAAEQAELQSPEELLWRQLRRELDGFQVRLHRFISEHYGPDALDDAWWAFHLWREEEDFFDEESPLIEPFVTWMAYEWQPDDDEECEVLDPALADVVPARAWLERRGRHAAPLLREYVEACLGKPFSFYDVLEVHAGRGLLLVDVLTGSRHQVFDKSASQSIAVGDLIYARLAPVRGLVLLEAVWPFVLPPIARNEVVAQRQRMQHQTPVLDDRALYDWADELREICLALFEQQRSLAMPQMQTTDGEDIEFHKLVFDIDSAQTAFDALKHLDCTSTEAELLEQAKWQEGRLERVEFAWTKPGNAVHAEWSNTSLGWIEIAGTRMTVQVQSRERAERFRVLAADALGERGRYRMSEVRDLAQAMAEHRERGESAPDPVSGPEIDALIHTQLADHYRRWVDMEIPALAGRTPREAASSPDGREQLEALLRQFEEDGRRQSPPLDPAILAELRGQLGLASGSKPAGGPRS